MKANIQILGNICLVILTLLLVHPSYANGHYNIDDNNCRTQDSLVLVDFHRNTFGDTWTNRWDLTQPLDTWYGVKLNESGCVECLDLDGETECGITVSFGNRLGGSIPARLGNLDSLKVLCLGNNRITGGIPETLFELKKLEIFDLFGNEIIGPLPSNIGDATSLRILSLAGNNLIGPIPSSIGDLKNLTELYLSNNGIIGPLPSRFGEARSLRNIRLNNNQIDGVIPPELGKLTNLLSLNIANNSLQGDIPTSFGNLINLTDLNLSINKLTSNFPEELGRCISMKRLRFNNNSLTGELPMSIGDMTNIEQFHLNDNNLEGCIPKSIAQCTVLTDLRLENNKFGCEIPREFGFLVGLRIANLSNNQFINSLPNSLGNLNLVEDLDVSANKLSGPLPAAFTGMPSLRKFNGQGNKITGPLPLGLDELERILDLNLSDNKIDGDIPSSFGEAPRLLRLNLSNNNLSGCFPESLRDDCDKEYDFTANPQLPWEGDLQQFCLNPSPIDAPCSTDPNIENETIQPDCTCKQACVPINIVQDAFLCINETIMINGQVYNESGQVTESLQSLLGCDSTITYNIVIMELTIQTDNAQCDNDESGSAAIHTNLNGSFDYTITDENGDEITAGINQATLPDLDQILSAGQYRLELKENDQQCEIDTFFTIEAMHNAAEVTIIDGIQCSDRSYEINGTVYNQANQSGSETLQTINGCDSLVLIDLSYLSLSTHKSDAYCENDNTGEIRGSLSDASVAYTCVIKDANDTEHFNETITGDFNTGRILATGNYKIELITLDGCIYSNEVVIGALYSLPEPVVQSEIICQGEEVSLYGEIYNSENSSGTAILSTVQGCDSIVNIELSFYEEALAYDDNIQLESNTISVNVLDNDEYDESAELSLSIVGTDKITLAEVDDDNYIYIEIDEAYKGLSYVEYEICNVDCDEICSRARLLLVGSGEGYQTSIITPNGDGYNEVMVVTGYEPYEIIPQASINIVNRWGQSVYSTDEYKNDWAGDVNGDTSKPLPEGVYYYHLKYRDGSSKLGSTSIIR